MFFYAALLMLFFVLAGFGATYLLLRGTSYAPYSHLLSIVSYPAFLVVTISLLGYRPPVPLLAWNVFVPSILGMGLTAFVCYRHGTEVLSVLTTTWKESAIISAITLLSLSFATPLLFCPGLAYIDWWNGELINYTYFASSFRGLLLDPNYGTSFVPSVAARYGAELFLAALSALTGKAPILLIEPLSALHKASAIIAFSVTCELLRRKRGMLFAPFLVADIGFAFATILSLNHVLAFLAAQSVAGASILLGLGLLGGAISSRRVQAFLAVHLLFILISYSEALPLLCLVGVTLFVEALIKYPRSRAIGIATIFAIGLLSNPFLAWQRLGYLYRLREAVAGFNVLGDPAQGLVGYLAAVLGLRYQFVDNIPAAGVLMTVAVVLSLAVICAAFITACIRWRTMLFVLIPALIIVMHTTVFGSSAGAPYYKSYKMIAAAYCFVLFAVARLLNDVSKPERHSKIAMISRVFVYAGTGAFIAGNIFISVTGTNAIKDVPSVYREADIAQTLAIVKASHKPVLVLTRDITASFWDLMANFLGTSRLLLDRKQAEVVYHSSAVALIEPVVFNDASPPVGQKTVFEGTMIVPKIAAYAPAPQPFELRVFLEGVAPGLRIKERSVLVSTSAFSAIDGALVLTGNSHAAPDGGENKPPIVVGISPNNGTSAEALISFVYSDPNGAGDVAAAMVNITSSVKPVNECFVSFSRVANELGLIRDGGTAWDAARIGSGRVLSNSVCALDTGRSSTAGEGKTFTLKLAFRFHPAFRGKKIVQTTVADQDNLTTGWQAAGWWDVPASK